MGTMAKLTLCLTDSECLLLLPVMRAALKKQRKKYEKFKDIQDSGEATLRQQTELSKAEDSVSVLESVLEKAGELIRMETGRKSC